MLGRPLRAWFVFMNGYPGHRPGPGYFALFGAYSEFKTFLTVLVFALARLSAGGLAVQFHGIDDFLGYLRSNFVLLGNVFHA